MSCYVSGGVRFVCNVRLCDVIKRACIAKYRDLGVQELWCEIM